MDLRRFRLVVGLVAATLAGCGPVVAPATRGPDNGRTAVTGALAIAQFARPLRGAPNDLYRLQPSSPYTSRRGQDSPAFRLPESVEAYRSDLINAIERGVRRSNDTVYQLKTMQWSRKYARTIYFTAIGYNPRMEPIWQMYGHYFLPGATANNPGAVIMQNQPLE